MLVEASALCVVELTIDEDKLAKLGNMIDGPVHHLFANKNFKSTVRGGPWSPKFKDVFDEAGIDLDDAINKIAIPGHKGPHPEAYHRSVYDRLIAATKDLEGDAYKRALELELLRIRLEALTPGSDLNKLLTKET